MTNQNKVNDKPQQEQPAVDLADVEWRKVRPLSDLLVP